MVDFNQYYGFHGLHGRAIPPAVGAKLANHQLECLVVIGDGGCYGEGGTHFLNLMRGNHDITVLVHDNHRYSLTTGQMSPTTAKGTKTKSTPQGSIEEPMNPIAIALSNHATFIAREFAGDMVKLSQTIELAVKHTGFALIDILQPCMIFNKEQNYDWYRQNLLRLENENHNPQNLQAAWKQAMRTDKLAVGLFYKKEKPAYHQQLKNLQSQTLVEKNSETIDISELLQELG
jgi:2-oxoglutarate ferredoxin oxidoreductase subunit beta